MRITPGAMVVLGITVGLSLIWLLMHVEGRATIASYLSATPSNVFEHGRVWTLVTSPFLETSFISLLLQGFMLWMLIPQLERFWGTARFYRFFAITSVLGTLAGTALGYAIGMDLAIQGLSPFMYAAVVAFGIIYAKQPVQFFGVLPLTGRQFMFGLLAVGLLFVLLGQLWPLAAAYAAAIGGAVLLTSKRWSPALAMKKRKLARARGKLSVMEGGKPGKPRDEQKWLN